MDLRRALVVAIVTLSLAACGHTEKSRGGPRAVATRPATLDCHGQTAVWVLGRGDAYVLPGDRRYGTSKRGKYTCLSDVRSQGLHAASHSGRRHHRHRNNSPFY